MTRERIERLPEDDWRKHDTRFQRAAAVAPPRARRAAAGRRRPPRHDARRGRGRLDAAQPGGRRRDRRLPPPRPGRPDPHRRRPRAHRRRHRDDRREAEMARHDRRSGSSASGRWAATWPARLLAAGHAVYGEEPHREQGRAARRAAACAGATRRARSPRRPTSSSAWSPTTTRSRRVASGPDGILAGLAAGQIWVDMSTVSPRASRELAERVARARGGHARRARVGQRPPGAERNAHDHGRRRRARLRARSSRSCASSARRTHIGENGQGLVLKLAINISLAVQMLAFARACCSPNAPASTASSRSKSWPESPIGSPMLKARAPLVLDLPDDGLVRRRR